MYICTHIYTYMYNICIYIYIHICILEAAEPAALPFKMSADYDLYNQAPKSIYMRCVCMCIYIYIERERENN